MNRVKIQVTVAFLLALSLFAPALPNTAQDTEPTDRPFPGVPATTATAPAEPTDRPFPGQAAATTAPPAEPTNRPFPGQSAATAEPPQQPVTTEEGQTELPAGEDRTATPSFEDVLATAAAAEQQIAELQAEISRLNTELAAAQSDNGATLFALVIIVVGVLIALGVFFGLRRGAG